MELKCYSKTQNFTDAMVNAAEERFVKLTRFLKEDEPVKLTLETFKGEKVRLKAQAVLKNNKHVRAQIDGYDYYDCLVDLVDNLKEQAKANKSSYKNRIEKFDETMPAIEEPSIKKIKRFEVEAITEGMAILEMERLGHESYIFKNINEEDKVCMIYRRMDGDYGLVIIDN